MVTKSLYNLKIEEAFASSILYLKNDIMGKELHIGHIIKQELRNQGRTITWLAKQLEYSRQNTYKILNRPWIYTDLLLKISDILNYDFFKCFSDYRNALKSQ